MTCTYHPDRPATHLADAIQVQLPECDECAADERNIGTLIVVPLDDVLDAEIIDA